MSGIDPDDVDRVRPLPGDPLAGPRVAPQDQDEQRPLSLEGGDERRPVDGVDLHQVGRLGGMGSNEMDAGDDGSHRHQHGQRRRGKAPRRPPAQGVAPDGLGVGEVPDDVGDGLGVGAFERSSVDASGYPTITHWPDTWRRRKLARLVT